MVWLWIKQYSLLIKWGLIVVVIVAAFFGGTYVEGMRKDLQCQAKIEAVQKELKIVKGVVEEQHASIQGFRNATVIADKLREQAEKLLKEDIARINKQKQKVEKIQVESCTQTLEELRRLE